MISLIIKRLIIKRTSSCLTRLGEFPGGKESEATRQNAKKKHKLDIIAMIIITNYHCIIISNHNSQFLHLIFCGCGYKHFLGTCEDPPSGVLCLIPTCTPMPTKSLQINPYPLCLVLRGPRLVVPLVLLHLRGGRL